MKENIFLISYVLFSISTNTFDQSINIKGIAKNKDDVFLPYSHITIGNSFGITTNILLLLSVILIGQGCIKNKTRTEEQVPQLTIKIPELKKNAELVKMSDLFHKIEWLKLETNKDVLLSDGISKIIEYKGSIFAYDHVLNEGLISKSNAFKVACFKPDGRFVRNIGRYGKGPGEYQRIDDFEIFNNEIILIDNNKFIYYDSVGGYLRSNIPNFRFSRFSTLDNNKFLFLLSKYQDKSTSIQKKHEIIASNSNLEKPTGLIKRNDRPNFIQPSTMVSSENKVFYNEYFSDIIFTINKHLEVTKAIKLEFDKRNLLSPELISDNALANVKLRKSNNYACIYRFYSLKDYFFFQINAKDYYYLIYSKSSGKIKLINQKQLVNDINEAGTYLEIRGVREDNNTLIGVVPSYIISENSKNEDCVKTELSKKTSLEDNPIVTYYKIKDF